MFTISLSIDLPWLVVVSWKNFGPHFLAPEDGLACAFISYADENRDMAHRLAIELEKFNVTVWLSGHDPIFGLKRPRALLLAIRNGVRFIACFSRESRGSCNNRMKGEIEVAAAELWRAPHDRSWFVPVLLNETKLPSHRIGATQYLSDLQFCHLFRNWDEGVAGIVKSVSERGSILENVSKALSIDACAHPAELIALSQLDETALFALETLLGNTRVALRAPSRDLVGKVGALPAVAVSVLATALCDPQESVRRSAIDAIRATGLRREALVGVVLAALNGSCPFLKSKVVDALRKNWVSVCLFAETALETPDAMLRSKIVDALGEVGTLSVPILAKTAADGADAYTRWRASRALRRLGSSSAPASAGGRKSEGPPAIAFV
jgi:hypothetical protein